MCWCTLLEVDRTSPDANLTSAVSRCSEGFARRILCDADWDMSVPHEELLDRGSCDTVYVPPAPHYRYFLTLPSPITEVNPLLGYPCADGVNEALLWLS